MSKNSLDKKLIYLFVLMAIIMGIIFYFVRAQEKEILVTESIEYTNISLIENKINKIQLLIRDVNNIFQSSVFDDYAKNSKTYIILPINIGTVGNQYPFGNYSAE